MNTPKVIMLFSLDVLGVVLGWSIVSLVFGPYARKEFFPTWREALVVLGIALGCRVGLGMVCFSMGGVPLACPCCGTSLPPNADRCHICGHVIDGC